MTNSKMMDTTEDVTTKSKKVWKTNISTTPNKDTSVHIERVMWRTINIIFTIACVFLLYKLGVTLYNKKVAADTVRKNVACPTLLSISRSARDTLLVMRAEPLCDSYVLEHIQ